MNRELTTLPLEEAAARQQRTTECISKSMKLLARVEANHRAANERIQATCQLISEGLKFLRQVKKHEADPSAPQVLHVDIAQVVKQGEAADAQGESPHKAGGHTLSNGSQS